MTITDVILQEWRIAFSFLASKWTLVILIKPSCLVQTYEVKKSADKCSSLVSSSDLHLDR